MGLARLQSWIDARRGGGARVRGAMGNGVSPRSAGHAHGVTNGAAAGNGSMANGLATGLEKEGNALVLELVSSCKTKFF